MTLKLSAPVFTLLLGAAFLSTGAFAGEDKDAKPAGPSFVTMSPLVFPVLSPSGIDQFISITVSLEVADKAAEDKINAVKPRLMDAYVQDLYGAIDSRKVMHGDVLDPTAIKAALEASNTKVLGQGVAQQVLLQNLSQRSLRKG